MKRGTRVLTSVINKEKRGFFPRSKRSQVWVETVIYTLIALVMIGLVLSFVRPKIMELQDKTITEQSIGLLEDINTIILSLIQGGPGNKRLVELSIRKGSLRIDGENDKIFFEMESYYTYSEPGKWVSHGDINIYTEKRGEYNLVTLLRDYKQEYNITYQGGDSLKTISKAPTPYRLFISNRGGNKTIINFEIG